MEATEDPEGNEQGGPEGGEAVQTRPKRSGGEAGGKPDKLNDLVRILQDVKVQELFEPVFAPSETLADDLLDLDQV